MRSVACGFILAFGVVIAGTSPSVAQTTTRVSVGTDGTQGNGNSTNPSISADGRYVAFVSAASNLVPDDTNGTTDVFVRDRVTGQTTLVSVATDGTHGDGPCGYASISADGRYVAFESLADNLVRGDTNGYEDVFVHDRVTGTTTRVSVSSSGLQGHSYSVQPQISADGRYVTFVSNASNLVANDINNESDVFVHDCVTGITTLVSVASSGKQANDFCTYPSISGDGRYVAFVSAATDLVPGRNGGHDDIFVHDRSTGLTTLASVASNGTEGNDASGWPEISQDGRYVAFGSYANNLVAGDANGAPDVFVHDQITGQTTRVSVASDGTPGGAVSGDSPLSISAHGRYVAFNSAASNLVPGDTNNTWDVFVHDRVTGRTTRVSVGSDGAQANGGSGEQGVSISADGRYVVFDSYASNLVPRDNNGVDDVFVYDHITRPSVVNTTPQSDAALVYPSQQVLLQFSEPMLKGTVEANTTFQAVPPGGGTPVDVPFTFQWYGTTAVRLVPDSDLSLGTDYTVTVGSNARTPDGRQMGQDFVLRFSTSGTLIFASAPRDGARDVFRRHVVAMSFRWRVREGSAEDRFSLTDSSGNPVSGSFTWVRPQQTLKFVPDKPLAGDETYTATMARGVRLADGRTITWPETFSFTTGDEPIVTVWAPKGDDVPVGRKIILIFDRAMHRVSVQRNFTVIPEVAGSFTWLDGNTRLEFTPNAPLVADTQYRVRVNAAARSEAGQPLRRLFTWTFHTAAPAATVLALNAAAAPTNGGMAQITVNLSAAANVGVTISNIAGRVVATLPAQNLQAGLTTLLWDGRSTTGTMAPAGRYLVTVQAQNSDGSTARCLIPLQR